MEDGRAGEALLPTQAASAGASRAGAGANGAGTAFGALPFGLSLPRSGGRPDDVELIALVLGGERGAALPLAVRLSSERDLVELSRSEPGALQELHGLKRREAVRLAAAFELGRRAQQRSRAPRAPLRSAAQVFHLLGSELRSFERESFHALLLDGRHALKRRELVSLGTLSTSLVHPREVFSAAVRESAAAVICAHNHPSGDPEPSAEDYEVTRRLRQAGELLGIPLVDHVVVGDGRYVSMRERMGF